MKKAIAILILVAMVGGGGVGQCADKPRPESIPLDELPAAKVDLLNEKMRNLQEKFMALQQDLNKIIAQAAAEKKIDLNTYKFDMQTKQFIIPKPAQVQGQEVSPQTPPE